MKTIEIIISGKVQGVFYRQSTREKAVQLGLSGFVENLPNGQVRVIVTGEEDKLDLLYQWCRQGPPQARVDSISRVSIPHVNFKDFSIKRK